MINSITAGQTAITKFDYEGSQIAFSNGENVMVNATQMAEKFGKTPKDWLRTKQSKDLINSLSAVRHISLTDLVSVSQGGTNQGTWMHEDVALMFAQWLSPEFYIWCNDRIKELARDGVAVISDDDAVIANAINILNRRLEEKQAQLRAAQGTIEEQKKEIRQLAPMADYTREVLQSSDTYTLTQIAKDMGFVSVHRFTQWAKERKILFYQSKQWIATAAYAGRGWFTTYTYSYKKADGSNGSKMCTVVTETGRAMLHATYKRWYQRLEQQYKREGGAI